MELLGTIATGLALFVSGHYLGFKLGRHYEKTVALKFAADITEMLRKRLGLSELEMLEHVKAIRASVEAELSDNG